MLTLQDIARMIHVYSFGTVYAWYREGFLHPPVSKRGKLMLWDQQQIRQFCKKKRFIYA